MKVSLLIIVSILLAACENNINESALVGTWATESCEQNWDSNQKPINSWSKALYEFTPQGYINLGRQTYNDSSCEELKEEGISSGESRIAYIDSGEATLQEGIVGNSLKIAIDTDGQIQTVEGYYKINDNALCFSEVFKFGVFGFYIEDSFSPSIDFEHCLVKI